MTKVEELKIALEAATTGPWEPDDSGLIYGTDGDGAYLVCDVVGDPDYAVSEQDEKNIKFIALAHNLMPTLLEAAGLVTRARSLIAEAMDTHIYNEADGEGPVADCQYLAFLHDADALFEKMKEN